MSRLSTKCEKDREAVVCECGGGVNSNSTQDKVGFLTGSDASEGETSLRTAECQAAEPVRCRYRR